MKKLSSIFILIFIGITLSAQNEKIDIEQPIIAFESEIIDYGTIEQGSDGVREFKFKNIGSAPLLISEARKSCGCTIPSFPKHPIKPGESSIIKVKYDTKRIGAINKTVTIVSNAQRTNIVLRIKGKVIAPETSPIKKENLLKVN